MISVFHCEKEAICCPDIDEKGLFIAESEVLAVFLPSEFANRVGKPQKEIFPICEN